MEKRKGLYRILSPERLPFHHAGCNISIGFIDASDRINILHIFSMERLPAVGRPATADSK
jgi:hypothetical protein